MRLDIVIIGGGVMGSSTAFFLRRQDAGDVTVIEADPTYELAASPRASGGCRRLFSRPENILMSHDSITFYRNFAEHVAVEGEAPEIGWKPQGYLFLSDASEAAVLIRNAERQRQFGVDVVQLDGDALKRRFPSLNTADVAAAIYSPHDGWLDPNAALQGFRRAARAAGAAYRHDRVVGLAVEGRLVREVHLASGAILKPEIVINTAGTWSAEICAMIGMDLPVEPMRRFDHFFECATEIEPLPFIKDPPGLGMRPEGTGYIGSIVDWDVPAGHDFAVDHGYFERVVWPAVAHRIPALQTLKIGRSWVGHYDRNRFDGNMILGSWSGGLDNFLVAAGFSGHGLMHAPAVGRALSELVLHGRFLTIDLSRMGYQRVIDGKPYAEAGIR
jgi:glycine/D-amino acid oxidase-like deaminating enzyme